MENLIFVHYPITSLFSSLTIPKRQTQLSDWTTTNTQHPSSATWITCSRFQHDIILHFFHWHHLCEARFQQLLQDKASTLWKSVWNRKWERSCWTQFPKWGSCGVPNKVCNPISNHDCPKNEMKTFCLSV